MNHSHTSKYPNTIIHDSAVIDPSVKIAPFVHIEAGVTIGAHTSILSGAIIKSGTTIGKHNTVGEYSVIGGNPQDLSFDSATPTGVAIGNHNTISEFVTIHRATTEKPTTIGNHNLLMTQAHVGHDGHIHDHVVITNVCQLAGFVKVFDHAFVSAHTGVHQFVRIGRNAMVGAFTKVTQDIPPFALAEGELATFYGLNVIGLRRAGFNPEERKDIKSFYEMFYQTPSLKKNLDTIHQTLNQLSPLQKDIFKFVKAPSKRGYITHKKFKL